MTRTIEQIAVEVMECATAWRPETCLMGNVTAADLVRLASPHITACPKCGAEPWVNIDCDLCNTLADLEEE